MCSVIKLRFNVQIGRTYRLFQQKSPPPHGGAIGFFPGTVICLILKIPEGVVGFHIHFYGGCGKPPVCCQ